MNRRPPEGPRAYGDYAGLLTDFKRWLLWERGCRIVTVTGYSTAARRFLRFTQGRTAVDTETVQRFRTELQRQGVGRYDLRYTRSALVAFTRFCRERGLAEQEPDVGRAFHCPEIRMPPQAPKPRRARPAAGLPRKGVSGPRAQLLASFEVRLRAAGYTRKTAYHYRCAAQAFLCWLGDYPQIGERQLREYRETLEEAGRVPARLRTHAAALRLFFGYLQERGVPRVPNVRRVFGVPPSQDLRRAENQRRAGLVVGRAAAKARAAAGLPPLPPEPLERQTPPKQQIGRGGGAG